MRGEATTTKKKKKGKIGASKPFIIPRFQESKSLVPTSVKILEPKKSQLTIPNEVGSKIVENRPQSRPSLSSPVYHDSNPIESAPSKEYDEKDSQARKSIRAKKLKVGNPNSKPLIVSGFRDTKPVISQSSTKSETKESKARNPIEDIVRKADISLGEKRKKKKIKDQIDSKSPIKSTVHTPRGSLSKEHTAHTKKAFQQDFWWRDNNCKLNVNISNEKSWHDNLQSLHPSCELEDSTSLVLPPELLSGLSPVPYFIF